MTTIEIIQGCKAKKASYQKALVVRFAPMLLSVCRRYAKNRSEADDVLQETFIRIFRSLDKFSPKKGAFEAWIRTIAVNTSLKYFDKNCFTKQITGLEEMPHTPVEPSIYSQLQVDEMMKMVASLPEGYRQVFNLYVIEGYSHKEISQLLKIGESSSRSNLARARNLLKTIMLENEIINHEFR